MVEELQSYREAVSIYRESLARVRTQAHETLSELARRQAEECVRLEASIARLRERDRHPRVERERSEGLTQGRGVEGHARGL